MQLFYSNDITNDELGEAIFNANTMYREIIIGLYMQQPSDVRKKLDASIQHCCSREDILLLIPLVRLLMENYPTKDHVRLFKGYAAAAILYYYYHIVMIDNANDYLSLKFIHLFGVNPEQIKELHEIVNTLVVSDEPYVVEIRRAILKFNPEEFKGGVKNEKNKGGLNKKKGRSLTKEKGRSLKKGIKNEKNKGRSMKKKGDH